MKKYKVKITLGIMSIILGILISTMMKSNVQFYAPATISSIESATNQINLIKNDIEELNDIIEAREEELNVLQSISQGDEDIMDILTEDLKHNKSVSGNTKIEGPGISIKMYDNQDSEIVGFDVNDDVIHDVDVLNIFNDLKIAGAEAISINNQRVLSNSEIKCLGPVIKVNGKSVGTPFIIKAIGDPQLLMAAVVAPGTYGDVLKNVYFIGFEPKIEDNIVIDGFSEIFNFKYAKPKGEGDI